VLVLLIAGHLFDRHHSQKTLLETSKTLSLKANCYQRGAHLEEDSRQDRNKHRDDTKKDQDKALDRYVL
jgi:hypothetical protein